MKNFLFFVLISSSLSALAQSYTKADSTRIYALLDSADAAAEMAQAMRYAQKALQLSQKTHMLRGEGWANLKIAYLQVENTENADVKHYWDTGIRIAQQLHDSFMLAIAETQQGKYSMYNNDLPAAEHFFQQALTTHFEKEGSKYTAILYNDLGVVSGKRGQREQEAAWYLKAMKLHERLGDLHGWANSAGNLANTFFRLGNQEDAVRYAKEALKVHEKNGNVAGLATVSGNLSTMYSTYNQLDSAVVYQQKAMRYAKINGQKKHLTQGYFNLALLLDRQQKYTEALSAIQQSLAISSETNDLPGVANKSKLAAELAAKAGKKDLVEAYYTKATRLADSLGRKEILRDIYASKAAYYERNHDFTNAYTHLTQYHSLKDSLVNVQVKKNIAELQVKYESERKDFEIAKLNTEQRIKQLEIEKQKAIIAGDKLQAQQKEDEIKLLTQQKKLREAVFLQQKELFEKQILLTKNKEQQLQLANQQLQLTEQDKELKDKQLQRQRLLQSIGLVAVLLVALLAWVLFNRYQLRKQLQEKEALLAIRNNISKDLHDEIGSSLTNINILNELAKRSLTNTPQATEYLLQSGENIQRISESLGDIVWNINPQYDDIDNLLIRMKRYASDMLEGANIQYELNFPDQTGHLKLPMDKRRDFYLFYKEAINNLVKYAKAQHATVKLQLEDNWLKLCIQDDGVGFDPQTVAKGNGINNMYYRASLLQGRVQIDSQPNRGTAVSLQLTL
ncbi:MAG: tetratricopeptide repeat protein [Spirosomataceae bacterium]